MAKQNVKTDKKTVEQPKAGVPTVQETAGSGVDTQATQEQPEGSEKELQVSTQAGDSKEADDKGNTPVDSEHQTDTPTKEGDQAGDPVESANPLLDDDDAEETYEEAKKVISKMVDDRLEEKGVITAEKFEKAKVEKCKKVAAVVFERHASCQVLYFTSDLIPFFEKTDALRHAGSIKDNTILTLNKE